MNSISKFIRHHSCPDHCGITVDGTSSNPFINGKLWSVKFARCMHLPAKSSSSNRNEVYMLAPTDAMYAGMIMPIS